MKQHLQYLCARANFRRYGFLLLLAFIFLANTGTASAQSQTYTYIGPAWSISQCEGQGFTAPPCIDGSVTGSVTFTGVPDGYSGTVNASNVASFEFDATSVGSLNDSNYVESNTYYLNSGNITGWQVQVASSASSALYGITTIGTSGGYDDAYLFDPTFAFFDAYGFVEPSVYGLWINGKSLGAPCDNPGGVSCANPINIANGNKYEEVSDYETAGQNKLSFTRYYNSMAIADSYADELGQNWRSNYDRYLFLVSSTEVQAERADGQIVNFFYNGTAWTTSSDVDMTLTNSGSTWTLTDHDDTVETYTASGSEATLQTIQLRNGYTQTMHYTGSLLTSVTDSYSRTLTLAYTSGLLHTVSTPDSLVLTYGYTTVAGNNLLTSVSYNTSPVTSQTYLYENASYPYALTGITDENGQRYATWVYDSTGRAISSQHGTGTTISDYTQVSYDDTTGNRTVTGPLGIQETYKFTPLQGVPKVSEIDRAANGTVTAATRTFGYDTNGYLNASTDWNTNSTTYVNDSHGDPTTINEAVGSPVARTTTIVYDTTWVRLPHTITTPGLTTTNNYDATTGNLLTQVLTDTTTQTIPYSTNGQTRTTTYTYTATGQLHTVQLPRTDVTAKTTYAYTGGTLTSITDPLSHVTTINTYTGGGLPLTITDPNSVLTTLAYDARLRLHTKVVTISGGSLTTTWDHDAAGNLIKLTQPDGTYLSYGYDNAHRLDQITNANGELMPLTLDANNDVTQVLWQTATPTTKRTNTATYDALGRRLTAVGGMSQTITYGYDSQSNLTTIETPLTWTTGQAFDALNRLQTITDPYTKTTGYTYDAHDRPLTVTDPNSHATTYIYDGFGEAISAASPDSGTTVYHYDLDGNVSSKTDAASAVTNWTYDAMDRPLTRKYPADATLNVAYTYDQTGHGDGITRLTSLTDQAGSLSLSYDESGNVTSNARTISGTVYTTGYSYYGQRLLNTITYPTAGWIATYAIDAAGQVTGITATQPGHAAVNLATSVTHLPFGPVASFTWGNGVTHATTFDADYRETNITDTGTSALQNLTYGYDADNNLHTVTDAVNAANSQTLTNDHLERLTGAVSGTGGYGTLSYTYDNNGNRKTSGSTTYTIATTSNRVTKVGTNNITYIATGNIKAIGTANTMTYNKANQTATSVAAGTTSTYTYDAFGNRLKVVVASGTPTVEEYDQQGNLITETNSGVETDYVYLDGMPIAVIQPAAATISYIHPDRLGTPQLATNASKASVWSTTYQPFGTTGTITGSITQNLRLPGQYADATGFNHNGFRNYNPVYGRYLESDPIGLTGGLNTYSYASNNPSKNIDPNGLSTLQIGFAGSVNTPFGSSIAAGIGLVVDDHFHTGLYGFAGPVVQVGPSLETGLSIQVSNAENITNLQGPFFNLTGTVGGGIGGSLDYFWGESNGVPVQGGGITIGAAAGLSMAGGFTGTAILPISSAPPPTPMSTCQAP
jgi:RHS repeat-associated protein